MAPVRIFEAARARALSSARTRPRWKASGGAALQQLRGWSRAHARPVVAMMAVAAVFQGRPKGVDEAAPSPEAALAQALSARGLSCGADDVSWVSRPMGVWEAMTGHARALVRAHVGDEPSDLYLVHAKVSPEGAVLGVGDAWNLTETEGAEESRPIVRGHRAVYMTTADGMFTGLHVLDLDGAAASESPIDLTPLQRAQVALTNLQRTGQTEGVAHEAFSLDPVARDATFAWPADDRVEIHADDRTIAIDPGLRRVLAGDTFVRVMPDEHARPGSVVPWAVDRVRAMPSFGDERMQWVKAIAFTVLDRWHAQFSGGTTAQDVSDELGLAQTSTAAPTFTDPEIGWPPPPMKTGITPVLPGEGQWIALEHDAFITPTASGAAPAFVTSFVRPDPHRQDVRVYVTLWDPRQVALHMEAGTVEPVGASGEHGPGLIPRTPEVMKHLVAGFNGGFQAQHGEFGMQANGIQYLPPKPYAATVTEMRDGSNGFGAWPGPEGGAAAAFPVPDDVIAFRQNLTAMVQNGTFNPWGRSWWGGTPPGWADRIHSTRSAICLTTEGFVGYFYSASISAEDLAQGMLYARCAFGIHLDMNPGHAGFEFYDVVPDGTLKPLARPLQSDWEAEGRVPDMAGYVFRSRRMIRGMWHMLFPRYIQREARDFFYLTARPILPGAPLSTSTEGTGKEAGTTRAAKGDSEPDEGRWRTKGLPQHGFPYAIATTWLRVDGGAKMRVLRADPRMMRPASGHGPQAPTVLSLTAGARGPLSLWWSRSVFAIAASPPTPDATWIVSGAPPSVKTARAELGVQDEDGMLVWVEWPDEGPASNAKNAAEADAWVERMGCSSRMVISGDARAFPGGSLDLAGQPMTGPAPTIGARLVRDHGPDAHPIFESTPIVPFSVWQPLQAKRVRYFYKPSPPSTAASRSPAPAAASADGVEPGSTP